ncbi:RepB family plasmid replication initiator protein [Pseudoalteromonas sp. HM-SA03]|nr:RepB family plasmid replication initiator protein [Pseudoalteromonas sp. HM-SA03]
MSQRLQCSMQLVSLKSDIFSMEYPVFALDGKSKEPFSLVHKGVSIQVTPSILGRATVKDKEIIIYCLSHLMTLHNLGFETGNTVAFTGYDFLTTMGRNTSGKDYIQLETALRRLAGTRITTNYKIKNKRIVEDVGLIEEFRAEFDGRDKLFNVTLADWLIGCTQASYILTLNNQYSSLTKPFDRRIYEICRKFCGAKSSFSISLDNVRKRLGIKGNNSVLRRKLGLLERVLDYRLRVDKHNLLIFSDTEKGRKKLADFQINQLSINNR